MNRRPIKISSNLTFSLDIPWDFGEQKANQIISGTQIPLGISKGISQAKSPNKISSDLTFSLDIPWDFGEQKANQIISETQIPLGISKGISQAKSPIKISFCFKSVLHLFCILHPFYILIR